MTIRNFWRVFLKGMGIWIITGSISVGLNFISVSLYGEKSGYVYLEILFLLIFSAGLIYLVIRYFLFKTDWLIDKLKLDRGFDDERIDISISSQTFIAIIISILGGIYFIDAIPDLLKALYSFYQQEHVFRQSPKSSSIVFYLVKAVAGYILMVNGAFLSKLVLGKSKGDVDSESN